MATNKGLLFGAALANGVNAFLDAREKGDLQRQRQALATVEQQMKQQQLANLQQVGQFQAQKMKDWPIQQQADRDIRKTQAEAALARATNTGSLSESEKTRMAILAGAGLLPEEGESNADYGKSLIDYLKLPNADPFIKSVIHEHLSIPIARAGKEDLKEKQFFDVFSQMIPQGDMTKEEYDAHIGNIAFDKDHPHQALALMYLGMASPSQILSNMGQATVQGRQIDQDIQIRNQQLKILQDKVKKKDDLPVQVKTDMINMFQGAGKVNPDLAKQLAGLKTYKDLREFWGNDDVVNIILNTRNPELFRADDGSIHVYDKNAFLYGDQIKLTRIMDAEEKYEGIENNDVIALQSSVTSNRSKWETAYAGAYHEVATKFRQFSNMLEAFNNGDIDATTFDIALITDFRKLLDKDSVVRESEFAIVRRLQPYWNRLLTLWEAEIKAQGGTLIDSSRQSLVNATREMMEGIQDEYVKQYEASASKGGTAWSMMNRFKVLEDKYDAETYERIRPKARELLGEKPAKIDISNYKVTRYTDSKKEDVGDGKRPFTSDALSPELQPAK